MIPKNKGTNTNMSRPTMITVLCYEFYLPQHNQHITVRKYCSNNLKIKTYNIFLQADNGIYIEFRFYLGYYNFKYNHCKPRTRVYTLSTIPVPSRLQAVSITNTLPGLQDCKLNSSLSLQKTIPNTIRKLKQTI